jgi:hypothetical protein
VVKAGLVWQLDTAPSILELAGCFDRKKEKNEQRERESKEINKMWLGSELVEYTAFQL